LKLPNTPLLYHKLNFYANVPERVDLIFFVCYIFIMPIDPKKPITVSDLPGGKYRWTRNPDNTYNILLVPIMTELRAGEFPSPMNEKPITDKWLQAAIDKAILREGEGHFGSVHENHHGSGLPDIYCGRLQLWSVGDIEYNGEKRACLYANLLRVPEHIFKKIQSGELTYRSIEGISWDNPEIVSLALMATETPFWRLPMLTLGEEASQFEIIAKLSPRLAASLNSGEKTMAEEKKIEAALPQPPPAPPKEEPKDIKQELHKAAPSETSMKGEASAMGEKTAPGGLPAETGEKTAPGGTEDNLEQHVRAFIKGCNKYFKGVMVDVERPEEKKPAEQEVKASDKGIELAEKQAKIDALEAKLAQKEQEDKVTALVAQAEKRLSGFRLTEPIRASMKEFAAYGDKALDKYVDVVKASLPKAAPSDPEQTTKPILAVLPDESEIMASIQAQPPAIQIRAKEWIEMGRRYISATKSNVTLKDYVLCNLKREGVVV
jgi:hypothetical protein